MKKILITIGLMVVSIFGHSQALQSLLVGEGEVCEITATIADTVTTCAGDITTVQVTGSGGSGTYNFNFDGAGYSQSAAVGTANLSTLGPHTVQLRDNSDNSCTSPVYTFDIITEFSLEVDGTTVYQGNTVDMGSIEEAAAGNLIKKLDVINNTGSSITAVPADFTIGNADFEVNTWDVWEGVTGDFIDFGFDPTGLSENDYSSTFVLSTAAIGCDTDGEYNIVLEATVLEPELVVSGNSITISDGDNTPSLTDYTDYGDIAEGSSFDRTFVLSNTGTGELNITNISLTFSPATTSFQIQTNPTAAPIAAGGTFDFVIRANHTTALAAGVYTATVQLTTDERLDNIYTWDIQVEVTEAPTLALDTITGATAAYSLRYLTNTYTGDVIEVERTSDNATQGFTPAEITDGTLTTWVGAGNDGHVITWYDQIGTAHFTETAGGLSTTPRIVINGTLVQENSLPVMDFDGSNDRLSGGYSLGGLSEFSHWAVVSNDNVAYETWYSEWDDGTSTSDDATLFCISSDFKVAPYARVGSSFIGLKGTTIISNNEIFAPIIFLDDSENDYEFYLNDGASPEASVTVSLPLQTSDESPTAGMTNANDVTRVWDGHIYELVFFDTDKEDQLALIQTYINEYYSIW